jgi:hypothetical protein
MEEQLMKQRSTLEEILFGDARPRFEWNHERDWRPAHDVCQAYVRRMARPWKAFTLGLSSATAAAMLLAVQSFSAKKKELRLARA